MGKLQTIIDNTDVVYTFRFSMSDVRTITIVRQAEV